VSRGRDKIGPVSSTSPHIRTRLDTVLAQAPARLSVKASDLRLVTLSLDKWFANAADDCNSESVQAVRIVSAYDGARG
jgi:hypothetical protein